MGRADMFFFVPQISYAIFEIEIREPPYPEMLLTFFFQIYRFWKTKKKKKPIFLIISILAPKQNNVIFFSLFSHFQILQHINYYRLRNNPRRRAALHYKTAAFVSAVGREKSKLKTRKAPPNQKYFMKPKSYENDDYIL